MVEEVREKERVVMGESREVISIMAFKRREKKSSAVSTW